MKPFLTGLLTILFGILALQLSAAEHSKLPNSTNDPPLVVRKGTIRAAAFMTQEWVAQLVTTANQPIMINGSSVSMRSIIHSGDRIETPSGIVATITLGHNFFNSSQVSLALAGNTNAVLTFGDGENVRVRLIRGCLMLRTNTAVVGEVFTEEGPSGSTRSSPRGILDVCMIGGTVFVNEGMAAQAIAGTGVETPMPTPIPRPSVRPTPTRNPTPGVNPSPVPSVLPTPSSSPTPLSVLDQAIRDLPWGNIAFNVPETIRLDELKSIQLVLSPTKSIEDVKREIQEKGKIESSRIQISDSMEAILTGSNEAFSISQVPPQRRPISGTQDTVWRWDVRAIKPGTQRLHVVLNAFVTVDGVESRHPVRQFDREYEIFVPWRQRPFFAFLGNNWQWLWTAILLPIAAWLWNKRRKREK